MSVGLVTSKTRSTRFRADSSSSEATATVVPANTRTITTVCPSCGNDDLWDYSITVKTRISLKSGKPVSRQQTREELRCGRCDRKAVMGVNTGVRRTKVFKTVQERESKVCVEAKGS